MQIANKNIVETTNFALSVTVAGAGSACGKYNVSLTKTALNDTLRYRATDFGVDCCELSAMEVYRIVASRTNSGKEAALSAVATLHCTRYRQMAVLTQCANDSAAVHFVGLPKTEIADGALPSLVGALKKRHTSFCELVPATL